MLTLVGLGLWDEKDLSLRGVEEVLKADEVYIELYTSRWYGNIENLKRLLKKEIKVLERSDIEEKYEKILEKAKEKCIALLVPGDPLIATTHSSLILEAKKRGIEVKVVHASSVYSAVAETGLHIYKFGASATVPFPERTQEVLPISTYEVIRENKKRGLHTLLFLDLIAEENKFMNPNEAMKILLKTEETMKEEIFTENTHVVVFCRAGSENSSIFYGKVKDLVKIDFGEPPYVLIVPGKLHFTEKEYLKLLKVEE